MLTWASRVFTVQEEALVELIAAARQRAKLKHDNRKSAEPSASAEKGRKKAADMRRWWLVSQVFAQVSEGKMAQRTLCVFELRSEAELCCPIPRQRGQKAFDFLNVP
jgi:hypothetical protein